ncbi:MAG TPA: RNHCP domain-containing protein [Methylomirabilota bacterium]|jgi:hypothetical protein|nr:RNHCP domain-containing protein [Methylomirabilota bacterium]
MKLFQRRKENFVCGNCGFKVTGTGYTNHCPKCLYSKHVDINPGDRLETCQGLMKPIGIEQNHGQYIIIHKCEKCKAIKKNKSVKEDDFKLILELSQ